MANFEIVRCPYCFREFRYNSAVFRGTTLGQNGLDPYLKAYHIANGKVAYNEITNDYIDLANPAFKNLQRRYGDNQRIVGVENPDPSRTTMLEQRLCPYCHNELLTTFGQERTKYIAVVGVPASGKTTYLAAVNDSMRNQGGTWYSLDSDASKLLDKITHNYRLNLPESRIATRDVQGPYFYSMDFDRGAQSERNHVVFFDIPGEFYTDRKKMTEKLRSFLECADGIIFIVNAAEEVEHDEAMLEDAGQELVSVDNILGAFSEIPFLKTKNVAIIINKIDKVKSELKVDNLVSWVPEPAGAAIDTAQIDLYSDRILGLMLGDGSNMSTPTQQAMNRYVKHIQNAFGPESRLFATSLLVENKDGSFTFQSRGAETPFLWLLAKSGAFPTVQEAVQPK